MTRIFTFLLLCCSWIAIGQNNIQIADTQQPIQEVERYRLPIQNNQALIQAEELRRAPGIAPRYAENLSVNITPDQYGNWEQLSNGNWVWRLRIHSQNAKSLNLGFSKYVMPQGGSLILYSIDQSEIRGPFTPADNEEHQQLWTPILFGDELVIEVQIPQNQRKKLDIELSYVNHDFMGFGQMTEQFRSGSCNVDVICAAADGYPEIDNYRDIIRSVAVISTGGGTFCTGFLVNNMRQDCTPYFMTADHCGINAGNAPSLVTYWNFENSTCRAPGSTASGGAGDGVLNDFNTGAIFRAGNGATDFTLVELDDPISPTANAFLAGWNANLTLPTGGAIAVHHPSTDEKRISFENDDVSWSNQYVEVSDWDLGTTEPGSSGSPVFDINKRVIGQLCCGGAACGNNLSDDYGGIAYSWTGGGTSATRLSDWLDPDGTGSLVLDGIDVPCAPPHCYNGVQDADETGVDCGGADCFACPTCSDGLQNQGELGVDCGGPCPTACPTCSDGILNQGEEMVDCGGPCTACPCLDNATQFTIVLDDYPEETTWVVTDDLFNIVMTSNGDYGNFADGETVVEEICLPDGCYNFILNDSYGDGICCSYGNGSYTLDFNGTTLAAGGTFSDADTTAFCLTSANCLTSYNLTGVLNSQTYNASNYIESDGIVVNGSTVVLQAGNYIDLNSDFEIQLGADFTAEIVACFVSPEQVAFRIDVPSSDLPNSIFNDDAKKVIRYTPTPFNLTGQIDFKLPETDKISISINNIKGEIVHQLCTDMAYKLGKHSVSIDKSNFKPGVYFISMKSLNGISIQEKIVIE